MDFSTYIVTYIYISYLVNNELKIFSDKIKVIFKYAINFRFFWAFITYFDVIVLEGKYSDSIWFIDEAKLMLEGGWIGLFENYVVYTENIYSYIIAFTILLIGENESMHICFNIIISVLTIYYAYRLSLLLGETFETFNITFLLSFVLYLTVFATIISRESILTFLITSSVYYVVNYKINRKKNSLIIAFLFSYFAFIFHGGLFALPLFVFLYSLKLVFSSQNRTNLLSYVVVLIIPMLLFFTVINGYVSIYKFGDLTKLAGEETVAEYTLRSSGYAIGEDEGSSYRKSYEITSIEDIIMFFPDVFIPFLLRPYIWQLFQYRFPTLYIHSIMWAIIMYVFIVNFRTILKFNEEKKFVLLVVISILVSYSFGSSMINQAVRHNTKIIPLLFTLITPFFKFKIYKENETNHTIL
jgi:hypothetical protein